MKSPYADRSQKPPTNCSKCGCKRDAKVVSIACMWCWRAVAVFLPGKDGGGKTVGQVVVAINRIELSLSKQCLVNKK